MKKLLMIVGAGLGVALLSYLASAKCASSVKVTSYGKTCQFFGQDAVLKAAYDAPGCNLTVKLSVATTCCNTFPTLQFLMISNAPQVPGLPLSVLVPGCELLVQPGLLLIQPVSAGGVWNFPVPAVPTLTSVYMQGFNEYFTTIGFTYDYQSSNGLQLDIL